MSRFLGFLPQGTTGGAVEKRQNLVKNDHNFRKPTVTEPPKRGAGVKVPDVATLVQKLKTEAKVI